MDASFSCLVLEKSAIILCVTFFTFCSISYATSNEAIDLASKCPHLLTTTGIKKSSVPHNNESLLVVVPWKVGFEQFVNFSPDSCSIDGFSVQVFLQAVRRMRPNPLHFKFVLHGNGTKMPSYDNMIDMVASGEVDGVVADLTMTMDRTNKVGFTVPYLATSLVMITPFRYGSAGTLWDFMKPFSTWVWIALLGCFVATGAALYLLENKNPDFSTTARPPAAKPRPFSAHSSSPSPDPTTHGASAPSLAAFPPVHDKLLHAHSTLQLAHPFPLLCTHPPPSDPSSLQRPGPPIYDQASHRRRILNAYWFTSLCVFAAQQESVRTHLGRFVTVMWLFVMLIFNSSYTASLASLLSAQKRYPTIDSFQALLKNSNISVGYQEGSFVKAYLKKIDIDPQRVKSFHSERDYVQALREGNLKPGGVGAVLHELPYVQILLQFECDLTKSSDDDYLPSFGGFGFAFQKSSPLIEEVSRMILSMAEDGTLQRLKDMWRIGGAENRGRCSSSGEPSHLRLRSFGGLFSVLGGVYLFCVVWHLLAKTIQSRKGSSSANINSFACCPQGGGIIGDEGSLCRRANRVSSLEHDSSEQGLSSVQKECRFQPKKYIHFKSKSLSHVLILA